MPITPAVKIAPGETVAFNPPDSSGGQITAASTLSDLGQTRFRQGQSGGRARFTLMAPNRAMRSRSRCLEFGPSGWGWTANIPGFGLLADQFKEPALHIWKYDAASSCTGPIWPGRAGAAEALLRHHWPGAGRGRACIRLFRRAGLAATWIFATLRRAPNFICRLKSKAGCSALAIPMPPKATEKFAARPLKARARIAAKFELVKGANLAFPRFTTPGPVTRHLDVKGYEVTTGIGPDLMAGRKGGRFGHDRSLIQTLQHECRRCLYVVLGLRRSADQRNRRHAKLGGLVLFPKSGVGVIAGYSSTTKQRTGLHSGCARGIAAA